MIALPDIDPFATTNVVPEPLVRFTLGDTVRKLREARGLTLRELANLSGVSYGALSRLENENAVVERRTIQRTASALGTDEATLLQYADPMFVVGDTRELLTLFEALDRDRQQLVLQLARRQAEVQQQERNARSAATEPSPSATGTEGAKTPRRS